MSGEEVTPVVEAKAFVTRRSSTTESSSPVTPERVIHVQSDQKSSTLGIPIASNSPQISPETDMSASYHEIFDTQMPPPVFDGHDAEEEEDMAKADERLEPLLCCDNNTASTTEYLTAKLVEDSIKWQQNPDLQSPKSSPTRRRPQTLQTALREDLAVSTGPKINALDPNSIEDIERHARYLAACVDLMVENLSGVLNNASGLTVNTLETYRDGVCKTCDEVDNNIKSMYQLMAKVEELNKSMAPAHKLGEQIKEIKQLLDVYEGLL